MYLVTSAEMREIDRNAVAMGVPALALMENAGKALALETAALLKASRSSVAARTQDVLVLAGPGQNGGDGFCAARHLSSMGHSVLVLFFGDRGRMPVEARINLEALQGYPVEVRACDAGISSADVAFLGYPGVVIDALLGTGQKGDPRPPIDVAVRLANDLHSRGVPLIACDMPTGLDSDTGRLYEPHVSADVTVTMGLAKIGLYSYPGRAHAGRILVAPLGLQPALLKAPSRTKALFAEDARDAMPHRGPDHHKGLSGHVTVIAGSVGMAGAAVLSAKGALRAGAGTVTLLCPGDIHQVCASMSPEIMVLPCGTGPNVSVKGGSMETIESFLRRSSCVVVGPGLSRGDEQRAFLADLLPRVSAAQTPCLIDADGLHALSRLGSLSYLAGYEGKFILTPHLGEMSDLTGVSIHEIGQGRPAFAIAAALQSKSVVCLKGAGTCVANTSGDLRVNTSGDPAMATGGSGDVLSGVIAALVSQGLSMFDASWLGVFWHGLAGEIARDRHGPAGVIAGDLCECLPEARRAIDGA